MLCCPVPVVLACAKSFAPFYIRRVSIQKLSARVFKITRVARYRHVSVIFFNFVARTSAQLKRAAEEEIIEEYERPNAYTRHSDFYPTRISALPLNQQAPLNYTMNVEGVPQRPGVPAPMVRPYFANKPFGRPYPKKRRRTRRRRTNRKRYSRYTRGGGGRRITYFGVGDYTRNPNDSYGTQLGGYLGSKAGEFVGNYAQQAAMLAFGLGDYQIRKNVLNGEVPTVVNQPSGGGTIIRFQEYLGDVFSAPTLTNNATDFFINSFTLNAANQKTFPFLSQLAANYEQYEIEGMIFMFRSTYGNAIASTNAAIGTVIMATQYDTLDPVFSNKGEMMNYEFSTSCKGSHDNVHMIECDPHQSQVTVLYTLDGTVPTNSDPRLYHLGRFNIASQGFQAINSNLGELHVTYQVRLLKPKLYDTVGGDISICELIRGAASPTAPLGAGPPVLGTFNNFTLSTSATVINWQTVYPVVKTWQVIIVWTGSANTWSPSVPTVDAGNSILNYQTFGAIPQGGLAGVLSGTVMYTCRQGANLQMNLAFPTTGTYPTGGTTTIYVNELPTSVNA